MPDKQQKKDFFDAGLGERRIVFEKNRDPSTFQLKLEEIFPRLVACGGVEVLRTSFTNKLQLEVIPPPASGYSATALADESCLGQALAYIRPVQRDLDMTPLSMEVSAASI